jgi:hypothetical protein
MDLIKSYERLLKFIKVKSLLQCILYPPPPPVLTPAVSTVCFTKPVPSRPWFMTIYGHTGSAGLPLAGAKDPERGLARGSSLPPPE